MIMPIPPMYPSPVKIGPTMRIVFAMGFPVPFTIRRFYVADPILRIAPRRAFPGSSGRSGDV